MDWMQVGILVAIFVTIVVGAVLATSKNAPKPSGPDSSSAGAALGVVLSLVAGVAAWWGARHWLIATITLGGTLQEDPGSVVNRAAAGVAVCVTASLLALVAAISSSRK